MLYGDDEFIREFCEAAADSFNEFSQKYREHLVSRQEEDLRRAGHKIKPVAQMIGVETVVEEYENAKRLLHNDRPDEELIHSTEKMDRLTSRIIEELKSLAN